MRGRLTALLLGAAPGMILAPGCGDSSPPATSAGVRAEDVSLVAEPGDRLVVATVNGQPIYADCVERQAAAHRLDARAALDECIDFELLAQRADEAGHRVDAEVLDVREREAVRALIDREFVARFDGPEDVPMEHVRSYYDEVKARKYVRPAEWRETQYARIAFPRGTVEGADEDREARELSHRIYAALKHRRDLTEEEFLREADEIAAPTPVLREPAAFEFPRRGRVVPVFADAAWEIPQPGMIHAPIRTQWGWDVILLTRIVPPLNVSIEEAKPEIQELIYELSRARSFAAWASAFGATKPEIDVAALERLAAASGQAMFGPAPVPGPPREAGTP